MNPPEEILLKGIEKFKLCIVGIFTKNTLSFKSVDELAHKFWGEKGLSLVSQKNATTFIFKFSGLAAKLSALSAGTCYFRNRPMILKDWDDSVTDKVTSLPLWVKFSNIPDCYWTNEGLSSIASVIGRPLCADARTSQLELLPFAKMCVDYRVGEPLPDKIPVMALDVKGNKDVVNVVVEYDKKPLVCSGCNELGHHVSACPISRRFWVRKEGPIPKNNPTVYEEPSKEDSPVQPNCTVEGKAVVTDLFDEGANNNSTEATKDPNKTSDVVNTNTPVDVDIGDVGWHTVVKKRPCSSPVKSDDDSPTPNNTFKNLARVDEVDALRGAGPSLSKSQKKKLRQRGTAGKHSPRFT